MSSILKVDTIQDQSGNNIINENADTITIGASGDTITIPSGATLDTTSATVTYPAGSITNADISSSIITGQTAETSIDGADLVLLYDDSASALRKMTRANFVSGLGGFETQLLHVRQEDPAGTNGGTFTSGAYHTRVLNTVMTNEISGASLASNQITLPSGTYFLNATAPAMRVEQHKLKLRNITDSSDTLIGTSGFAAAGQGAYLTNVVGRFTIGSSKDFELQHRCSTTQADFGFGINASMGAPEVFADVQIWKVS